MLAFGALMWAAPVLAQAQDPLAPMPTGTASPQTGPASNPGYPVAAPPLQPVPVVVAAPKDWRGVFDAIDSGNWSAAQAGIATLPRSILTPLAKAELYTAKGSPVVDLGSLVSLIAEAPELPQADQLALMAYKRGATTPLLVIPERATMNLGAAPVRYRTRPVQGEPVADQLRALLDPLIKADDAAGAEAQMLIYGSQLSVEARAEAGQRIAFVYYVLGLDADARRVADTWRQGATSEWSAQAAWVSGLASWRLGDCESASRAFQQTAAYAQQRELRAGALYWGARAEQACNRPRGVEPLLKAAAQSPESFYGLVARQTLGMDTKLPSDPLLGFDPPIEQLPNVQRAVELVSIGEPSLAEELLRHQAKIGLPTEHHALIQLAKKLDLPAAQLWLANNGQPGARSDATDRYPNPRWSPANGWRVDPALAFGHVVQESSFRRTAVSPAGAVGLMQVRPGTAGDTARARGTALGNLSDPATNLEYGQTFIELMRSSTATAGQLPRVIASYNAGPLPVGRWASINDKGDPLLWIESIPYWETRYYVPAVLRNMWVYQGLNNEDTSTLKAIAEHRWPSFPTSMTRLAH
ncbi:lytic transglycosylase domain-containing protein [Sphingomonas limnosediminicola]|uniref:Lytic transglycosylase domain-containing protein n=1 Tax=Sphingomonas limnosediminicola TaxID=940133 RepID=A0ABP7KXV8_9SPHN